MSILRSWTRFGIRLRKRRTLNAQRRISEFSIGRWTFSVRSLLLLTLRSYSPPDVDFDQRAFGHLGPRGAAHGAGDFDAAPEKRGARRGVWRWGKGKYFRSADDQCAGEIHCLAGWFFFPAHLRIVDLVFAQKRGQRRAAP